MGMVVHDLIPVLKSQRRADLGEFQALSQKKKLFGYQFSIITPICA